jgi:hypothetical protein
MTIQGTTAGFTSNEAGVSDIRVSEDITVAGAMDVSGVPTFRQGISVSAGSIVSTAGNILVAGSRTGITANFPAGNIVSGGMWVTFVSGTGIVVESAAASTSGTIGVATATAASGGTVNVMLYGVYNFLADVACLPGDKVIVGAGAARNTVASAGSPYSDADQFAVVGRALQAAASGAAVLVALGI